MPPAESSRKKPTASTDPLPTEGKRKRNRTTQSCLQCHHSKRMCDRKRAACGRCTQLGLTGLCVYEADDPNATQPDPLDETTRLRARVAELEGVVRKLRNKPDPKWMATLGEDKKQELALRASLYVYPSPSSPATSGSRPSTAHSNYSNASLSPVASAHEFPPHKVVSSEFAFPVSGVSPSQPSRSAQSSNSVPSPHNPSVGYDGSSPFMGSKSEHGHQPTQHSSQPCYPDHAGYGDCGCLDDTATFQAVMNMSMKLQATVDVMGRSMNHRSGVHCALAQRLVELDTFTTNTLNGAASSYPPVQRVAVVHKPRYTNGSQMYTPTWDGTPNTSPSADEAYASHWDVVRQGHGHGR